MQRRCNMRRLQFCRNFRINEKASSFKSAQTCTERGKSSQKGECKHKIRCLVLPTVQSHQERNKEFFKKLFLAAHSCSFRKNGTVDVSYPNNDFLFIFSYWD